MRSFGPSLRALDGCSGPRETAIMPTASLSAVLRQVYGLAEHSERQLLPDRQLLEQFVARRDEAAFAVLVGRHGGMVLGVAQRILHDTHAAEDVFQNTFLTLARRAGSIRSATR